MKKDKNSSADAGELRRRAEERLRAVAPEEAPARAEADTQRLVHELQVHQIELEMQNEELRQSRGEVEAGLERYTDLYDFAPVGYLTLGRDGAIRQVNLTAARMLGVDRARLPGRRFGVFIDEPDRAGCNAFLEKVFANQAREVCEVALLQQGKRPLIVHITAMVSQDGQECRVMMEDITERKQVEQSLRKAHDQLDRRVQERTAELVGANEQLSQQIEERNRIERDLQLERNKFKSILEAMADGVYIANRQHKIEYVNPVIEREFGPVNGRTCYEYFHDRTEGCPWCQNQEVFTGKSVQWEWHSLKSGKTYEVFDAPVPNADGSISRLEILHDITWRKKAEEALRESEIKYRIVADNTYDWEWWRDPEGNFIFNSPSCKRVTQHEVEEFAADPDLLSKIIHPDDRSSFSRHKEEVEQTDAPGEIEFRIIRPDGSLRWLSHVCQPVFDQNGGLLGRRGSNRDITDRKTAEEQLKQSEKQLRYLSAQLLAAQETERRRISQELHDELGGALAFLKLRFSRVGRNLSADQAALQEECRKNLHYIDQIIEDVHRISRDLSPSILEDIGFTAALNWLIDNFSKYHLVETTADIEDVDHLLERENKITIYRILQESFNNIGKHAQAGNVSMKVKKNENRIYFFVEDDGRGFDVVAVARKKAAERRLGLAIMHERARMLGGVLDLWSKEGKGTRITLSIPIKEKGGL